MDHDHPRSRDHHGEIPAATAPAAAEALDLRARRRLETQSSIHRAAVDLFEAQGVRKTTVEEIAARAGVSPRTFFRHFPAKEHAALPGVPRLESAIDALDFAGGTPSAALRAVESMLIAVVAREPRDELRENRRLRHIIESEPEILGWAVAQDQEMARRLRGRLLEVGRPGGSIDASSAHLVAAVALAVWRSGWDLWATRGTGRDIADPVAVHHEAWSAVRGMLD